MRDREALQTLLARARARVDPAELGLAPRADPRGRKVEGLTHEHMTRLLGWPEHKYGYVERGKLANISTEVLAPIARILHLSDHEWEALVLYATGLPPAFRLDPQLGTAVPRPWERLLAGVSEMAYINDVAWDVVAYNSTFARMFKNREVPGNTMRWMLLHPQARETLADWRHSWLPLLVPQLRAAVAANPHNRTLARLQADAKRDPDVGPVFESPIAEYIQPRAEGARPLLHAELGLGWATMCAAGPFGVPGGRLMFVLFDQGERPQPSPPMYAPAHGPVDLAQTYADTPVVVLPRDSRTPQDSLDSPMSQNSLDSRTPPGTPDSAPARRTGRPVHSGQHPPCGDPHTASASTAHHNDAP